MEAKNGSLVKVHYTGKINEEVFDSSEGKEPLMFKVGDHRVIKGFEDAVVGMKKGDKKTVEIPKEDRDEIMSQLKAKARFKKSHILKALEQFETYKEIPEQRYSFLEEGPTWTITYEGEIELTGEINLKSVWRKLKEKGRNK